MARFTTADPRGRARLDCQDLATYQGGQIPDADQVMKLVPVISHSAGTHLVRDIDIPQPWRDHFLCASRGATRLTEGAYLHDWKKFISEWKAEIKHLKAHRAYAGQSWLAQAA
ncbi:hypothetical protein D3C76_1538510 [compost metagenome]|nr:hypothetical protein SAMN05216307_3219 [Pseudomonas putida]SMQ00880.1 hypothetical protein SAMN05216380_1701 [Pseudomonas putida]